MSEKIWSDDAWEDYLYWQTQENKESGSAGFSACGGLLWQHLPLRRSAILPGGLFCFIGRSFL